jgi:hypothetical protein
LATICRTWRWRNPLPLANEHPKAQPQTPEYFIRQIHELAAFVDGADLFLATAIRPHGLAAHHFRCGEPYHPASCNQPICVIPEKPSNKPTPQLTDCMDYI